MADPSHPSGGKRRILLLLTPFFLFFAFIIIALARIQSATDELPSALAGKSMPQTILPLLEKTEPAGQNFSPQNFSGRVTLINFWGSWCPPCRQEHPVLMRLAQDPAFDLIGINYKDRHENALRFLGTFGNPFRKIGFDPSGKAAIDWGVYGPPETFVIDKNGTIIYRHIGPLTNDIFNRRIRPVIATANSAKPVLKRTSP